MTENAPPALLNYQAIVFGRYIYKKNVCFISQLLHTIMVIKKDQNMSNYEFETMLGIYHVHTNIHRL